MKSPLLWCTLGFLGVAASLVACTQDATLPEGMAGAPSSGGSASVGGTPSSSAGTTSLGGGSGMPAQAGMAGMAGTASTTAGSASGGQSGQAGAGGASGGATTGGSAGSATGGEGQSGGGAGGGSSSPAVELNGESWTMKCSKPDTAPDAENRCYLLPPGQDQCGSGYTSVDKTLHFGGTPGTTYQVTIRFQGTHEAGDYQGGTKQGPKGEFLTGATHINGGLHTWLSMEVSSPAATYNPNAGGGAGSVQVYDYTATIPIAAGATVRLKAFDIDCLMHRYCQNNDFKNCKGYVLPPISPAASPIDGSFLQMSVMSVTPM